MHRVCVCLWPGPVPAPEAVPVVDVLPRQASVCLPPGPVPAPEAVPVVDVLPRQAGDVCGVPAARAQHERLRASQSARDARQRRRQHQPLRPGRSRRPPRIRVCNSVPSSLVSM